MTRPPPPGRRLGSTGGSPRRHRADDTLPGVRFPVVEDLSSITADDDFLDAIAAGGSHLRGAFAVAGMGATVFDPDFGVPAGGFPVFGGSDVPAIGGSGGGRSDGLAVLLGAWRSELLAPPLPNLPTLAPRPMLAPADRSRRRSMRSLLSVGVAICALLLASTAVGARSAQPGQPLWGLSRVLWSEHADSVEAKVTVENAINVATQALAEHNPAKAQRVLDGLEGEVAKVLPADGRALLQNKLIKLQQQAVGVAGRGTELPAATPPVSTSGKPAGSAPVRGGGEALLAGGPPSSRTTASKTGSARTSGSSTALVPAGQTVPPGPPTTPGGGTSQPVPGLPIVPVGPATSSSPQYPPVTTADPGTTAPGVLTTAAPVDPSTPGAPPTTSAVVTDPSSATSTAAPDPSTTSTDQSTSSPDPSTPTTDPSTPSTDPSTPTTDPPPSTSLPSTSGADPSTSSTDPSTPTTDTPSSTDDPGTGAPTQASTTSQVPSTVSSTPSTDSDGSTTSDTSSTTTQPAGGNDTTGTAAGDALGHTDVTGTTAGDALGHTVDAGRRAGLN